MVSRNYITELYGVNVNSDDVNWSGLVKTQNCPYLNRKCLKNRNNKAQQTIGTCTVNYGREQTNIIICPHRLLDRRQIFIDCIHLLTLHEPGNELHVVNEVSIPGGNVDYFLLSARDMKVKDFVAIELQTLDTTGTIWPFRQRFLQSLGIPIKQEDADSKNSFGMDWKITAKNILVQMYQKIETFEHINKHLVLVMQDRLLNYIQREFSFSHIDPRAKVGDSMHFHSYKLKQQGEAYRLTLGDRKSTDANGIARCLGLESEVKIDHEAIIKKLQRKISEQTLLTI